MAVFFFYVDIVFWDIFNDVSVIVDMDGVDFVIILACSFWLLL